MQPDSGVDRKHPKEHKEQWEPMKLSSVGHVSEVVEQGGGKITFVIGDPGEPRKVKPTG